MVGCQYHSILLLITLAGDPATKLCGGTLFVTVALVATTEPSPIVTPGMILHPVQSQT